MAGYSGTPLVKSFGFKPDHRLAFVDAPLEFADVLGPLPEGATLVGPTAKNLDAVVLFVTRADALSARFAKLAQRLTPTGMLWVAWPKKASGVPTDVSDNVVRVTGLDAGLVDVKVCAIDDVWSGLKFVVRVRDRPAKTAGR